MGSASITDTRDAVCRPRRGRNPALANTCAYSATVRSRPAYRHQRFHIEQLVQMRRIILWQHDFDKRKRPSRGIWLRTFRKSALPIRLVDTVIGAAVATVFGYLLLWPGARWLPAEARLDAALAAAGASLAAAVKPPSHENGGVPT
jgi:hypothetical protein